MVLLFLTLSGKFTTLLWICLYNMFYPSLYPLLFFPAHGKILAWAGRKKIWCIGHGYDGADGRRDKAAESGDVDYDYHQIIKGLYATGSSWHIDPCRFPWSVGDYTEEKSPARLRKQDGGFSIIWPIMMLISFKYLASSRFCSIFASKRI